MRKSRKSWKCSEGCDPKKGVPCPHLEKLLPQMNERNSSRMSYVNEVFYNRMTSTESLEYKVYTADCFDASTPDGSEYTLRGALAAHDSLDDSDVEFLVDLFVNCLSSRKLMPKYGFKSFNAFHKYKKYLFKLLKKEGFKPVKEYNEQ